MWFNKQVSCINGPYDPVHMPKVSDKLDYEAELGVVIGQRCRHVKAADARSVIAGTNPRLSADPTRGPGDNP